MIFFIRNKSSVLGRVTRSIRIQPEWTFEWLLSWSREHSGSGSVDKIKEGFITILAVKLDFTDYDTLDAMNF